MSNAKQPRSEKKPETPKAKKAPRVKTKIKSGGDVLASDRFSGFAHT
jgi:hypothetical protein